MGRLFSLVYKPLVCLFVLTACTGQPTLSPPLLEGPYSLLIKIDGLACCSGVLRVGVYHDADFWMREDGMVRGRIGMVMSQSQSLEVHGLPAGSYSVAVHQDINGDGKFNRLLGILPKEPYGFSNNVGKFGPASFDQAAVVLDGEPSKMHEVNIHMHTAVGGK